MKNKKTELEIFGEVVESMPVGVVVFERVRAGSGAWLLKVVAANDLFCRIAGRERADIETAGFSEIFPGHEEWKKDVHGNLLAHEWDGSIFLETEEYMGPPVRKWIYIRAFRTASGCPAMIIEDVTSQSRTKQALQRQRSHITF